MDAGGAFCPRAVHGDFAASSKLDDAPWGDVPAATVTRDPTATIRQLKEQNGKDIWLWGSLQLMHSLPDAGAVDEVRLLRRNRPQRTV